MDLPPEFAWAAVVPELLVTDLAASLRFWCGLCGFQVAYERPEEGFAYLDRAGRQVMLEEVAATGRRWITGELARPFGRGMNLQIDVATIEAIVAQLRLAGWPLYLEPEERWYRVGNGEVGVHQFVVQDPDGYLIRFSQRLGIRAADGGRDRD